MDRAKKPNCLAYRHGNDRDNGHDERKYYVNNDIILALCEKPISKETGYAEHAKEQQPGREQIEVEEKIIPLAYAYAYVDAVMVKALYAPVAVLAVACSKRPVYPTSHTVLHTDEVSAVDKPAYRDLLDVGGSCILLIRLDCLRDDSWIAAHGEKNEHISQ